MIIQRENSSQTPVATKFELFYQVHVHPDLLPCESIMPYKARMCSMSAMCQDSLTAIVVGGEDAVAVLQISTYSA